MKGALTAKLFAFTYSCHYLGGSLGLFQDGDSCLKLFTYPDNCLVISTFFHWCTWGFFSFAMTLFAITLSIPLTTSLTLERIKMSQCILPISID